MKIIEEAFRMGAIKEAFSPEIIRHIETECRHPDGTKMMDEQCFYEGAKWAAANEYLIDRIIFEYMRWAKNLPAQTVDKWDKEEGGR